MRATYRSLAYAIAGLVVLQAAAIAMAAFGVFNYMEDHSIARGTEPPTPGGVGFAIHALNGQFLIPLVAIVLLIVAFFAKIPGGAKWAGFVLLDVIVQIALAFVSFGVPQIGFLHGLNALVLFGLAVTAGRRVATAVATVPEATPPATTAEGTPAAAGEGAPA